MDEDRVETLKITAINAFVDCRRSGRGALELAFRDSLISAIAIVADISAENVYEEIEERALAELDA